jgi:exosortase A
LPERESDRGFNSAWCDVKTAATEHSFAPYKILHWGLGKISHMPYNGQPAVQRPRFENEPEAEAPDLVIASENTTMSMQWKIAVSVFLGLFVAFLALFWESIGTLIAVWGTGTYSHGFLIFPVTAFLIWNCRRTLLQIDPRPEPVGLVLLAGSVCVWLMANVMGIQLGQHFALIAMIQCLVLAIFGWSVTKQILFPLFFLFFAVPFGSFLIAPLQDVTAHLSVAFLRLTGIPVYLDELFIYIPTGSFVVAEACSGVRFLISTIVLGVLLAHVMFKSWWRRLVVVCLSLIIPIIANGVRAYGIVLLAHLSNFEIAVGADHILYGGIFFGLVTLCLLAAAIPLRDKNFATESSGRRIANVSANGKPSGAAVLAAGMAAVLILASGPAYSAFTAKAVKRVTIPGIAELSIEATWHRVPESPMHWQPTFRGADAETLKTYADENNPVTYYVAFYTHQRAGSEVVNEMNRLADEEIWRRMGSGSRAVNIDGHLLTIRVLRLASTKAKRLVWYWYWVDGHFTGNHYLAKLFQARARLFGGIPAAAVVAVAADYEENPETAVRSLENFLESVTSFEAPLVATARAATVPGS